MGNLEKQRRMLLAIKLKGYLQFQFVGVTNLRKN